MPEQVEHLELDHAEFQERPPSQPLECAGGGGTVEPEEQEQPSIGAVERARWIGSALPSRRRGTRVELASEGRKTLQVTSCRVSGGVSEGTKFRGYRWFMGLGGPRISPGRASVNEELLTELVTVR